MGDKFLKNKIALIGGGVMGRGLAQLAAQKGFNPFLFNRSEETRCKSKEIIQNQLQSAFEKKRLEERPEDVLKRITFSCDQEMILKDVDLLIESLPEDLELKKKFFEEVVDKVPAYCVLATNTSSLSVWEIAQASGAGERLCGMHFFNPPYAMKLLEVVTHEDLDAKVLTWVLTMSKALGREAIQVKDVPGFATSRLSVCIGLEAIRMVEQGVATAADIDKAMKLGYRHPMGPLELGDYIGLDVRMKVAEELHERLDSEVFRVPELLKQLVAEGKTGKKAGQGFYKW